MQTFLLSIRFNQAGRCPLQFQPAARQPQLQLQPQLRQPSTSLSRGCLSSSICILQPTLKRILQPECEATPRCPPPTTTTPTGSQRSTKQQFQDPPASAGRFGARILEIIETPAGHRPPQFQPAAHRRLLQLQPQLGQPTSLSRDCLSSSIHSKLSSSRSGKLLTGSHHLPPRPQPDRSAQPTNSLVTVTVALIVALKVSKKT